MAEVIRMPLMSDTMKEGVIVEWYKKEGDQVKSGDILAEVETDKATMELESYDNGTLLYIGVKKGDSVPVDGILAVIGEKGEDFKELLEKENVKPSDSKEVDKDKEKDKDKEEETTSEESTQNTSKEKEIDSSEADSKSTENGRPHKASPLAKKMAKEHDLDIKQISGSGDNNRVVKRDIEAWLEKGDQSSSNDFAEKESYEDVSISQMRKTIAARLSESKFSAPHYYLNMEIDMGAAILARKKINDSSDDIKISVNDMIIKSVAMALRKHPQVNASWMNDKIRYYKHIHIGVAVAVDEGLLVPVVRFADFKGLDQISKEVKDFADKAKNKKLQADDWKGNTFTISNLGMFDIDSFTAIINPPDACILAVGCINEIPAFDKDDKLVKKHIMKVTLSCDHRIVDGVTGSKFLLSLKNNLEEPVRMLI